MVSITAIRFHIWGMCVFLEALIFVYTQFLVRFVHRKKCIEMVLAPEHADSRKEGNGYTLTILVLWNFLSLTKKTIQLFQLR